MLFLYDKKWTVIEDSSTFFFYFLRALKRVNELAKNFKKEVVNEIKGPSSPKAGPSTKQSTSREREDDPLRVPPRQNPRPRRDW